MRSSLQHIDNQPIAGYPFTIDMDGGTIYEGRYNYPYYINIAEIVDAYVAPLPDPLQVEPIYHGPFLLIEDEQQIACREVFVNFSGAYDDEFNFIAIPGGISKQNLRIFGGAQSSIDIFTERFLAPDTNCFLTTRTSNWQIEFKETELFPTYLLIDTEDDAFRFVDAASQQELVIDKLPKGIYALDIDALRLKFAEDFDVLANCFDVYHRDNHACRIVIEQCDLSKDRYRLKFRNSLGVFEIIEIPGELSVTPEWPSVEESVFQRYDRLTAEYISDRNRIECKQTIAIKTSVHRHDRIHFILDMLSSDEVYLLDKSEIPIKVRPSVESFEYTHISDTPMQYTLTLEPVETDTNISPDIADGTEARRKQIFSNQFNKKFS